MCEVTGFARYELLGRIGVGGTATVYLARTRTAEGSKPLALKVLFPSFAEDAELVAMFSEEAKLVAELVHPHITQVLDFGRHDGRYYIAMEYVAGANAAMLQRAARIPLGGVVAILRDVLYALHYAHEKRDTQGAFLGVVHRDVSPHNVLISREGAVKVTDFGTAKVALNRSRTRSGVLKGKFAYMSPEHARGLAVDRRSDIFSAGLLAYELLSGNRAYAADSEMEVLSQAQAARVAPIANALWPVLQRALSPEPEDRYATATDFAHALTTAVADTEDRAWDAHALGRFVCAHIPEPTLEAPEMADIASPEAPRSRALVLVLAAIVTVALAAVSWKLRAHPQPLVATPEPVRVTADPSTRPALDTPKPVPVAPAAFGYLTINSRPWSKVMLDGALIAAETPLSQKRVAAGTHTITLLSATGERISFPVAIAPGRVTTRFFDWTRKP